MKVARRHRRRRSRPARCSPTCWAGPASTAVALELRSRQHVLDRIRAGVLEWGTVKTLRAAGLGARLDAEGHVHDTVNMAWDARHLLSIDLLARTGRQMMAYGQTEIQHDLYDALDAAGIADRVRRRRCHAARHRHRRPAVTYRQRRRPSASSATTSPAATATTGSVPVAIPAAPAHRVRQGLPVRLARHPLRDAAAADPHLRPQRSRVRAVLAAHADAQPLLRAGALDRHRRRLARRPLLDRAARPRPARAGRAARDRPVDREVAGPTAQLRQRADALRAPAPRRRRRAHRPAHRRQGPQPRRQRRATCAAARRPLRRRRQPLDAYSDRRWRGSGRRCGSRGG